MKLRPATIFGALLLVSLLGVTLIPVLRHSNRQSFDPRTVIRFAHTQLEPGLREAFAEAATGYMALHPEVAVEQIAVPRRIWAQWMETRLIGDDPPDLLQTANNDPNPVLRHFRPLDPWMAQANPYNAGTPLAGVPWQDTFITPMLEPPTYWPRFLHYYSAPLTIFTMRVIYNRELLREITGEDRPPQNFAEYVALCRQIQAWAKTNHRPIFPAAGSRPVAPNDWFFTQLLRSQTQRLTTERVDRSASLGGGGGAGGDNLRMAREAWYQGVWSLRSPEIQSGFQLIAEIGRYFQPGFTGADRDEAMFYFIQGRSVMLVSGSWDYPSIASQVGFKIGIFPLPIPRPDDSVYGRFTLGQMSEAANTMRGGFALSKRSRHPELAVDFLRYLTSVAAHRKFSARSNWLPVVRGVETPEPIRALAPIVEGAPPGFNFTVGVESTRLWEANVNLLYSADDGVERLTRALEPVMERAVLLDETKESREVGNNIAAYDASLAADTALRATGASPLLTDAQRSELLEAQADLELGSIRMGYLIGAAKAK